ncbi:MAG TPA: hypothetical protein VIV12_28005 [Streptosporangiaceae bacterium]
MHVKESVAIVLDAFKAVEFARAQMFYFDAIAVHRFLEAACAR